MRIYLDYAAASPLRDEVAERARIVNVDAGFNPSSPHAEGRRARALLDAARDRVAACIGAVRSEVTFAGSGTEADNLALLGVMRAIGPPGHVVASATEHHAIVRALDRLRDEGFTASVVPVEADGRVHPERFARALTPQTKLASVMYANNEIGTVQPVAELARIARERGVLFHTDAIAAASWLPLDVAELGVDLLSLSAHKFGGPAGVGILFARSGVPIVPIHYGGAQEAGRRPGSENVAGNVAAAFALELAVGERRGRSEHAAALRDRLEAGIIAAIPGVRVNGAGAPRLPNMLNVSFDAVESEALLIALDLEGIAASAGSACTSGALEPSHVLLALGLPKRWRTGAIRFSLGTATGASEIDRVLAILPRLVASLRRPAPAL